VTDNVWRLNDNFVILGIEGVLNMLNCEGCQELDRLRNLATSHVASAFEDVPNDMHKLAEGSCGGGGNHMDCLRPFISLKGPTP
jgi:hypothetical protein